MAIPVKREMKTYSLLDEVASTDIMIKRSVSKSSEAPEVVTNFEINIRYDTVVYELDAEDKRVDIYEIKDPGAITLKPMEIYGLFSEPVTLQDGTVIGLGDLIAKRTDSLLKAHLGLIEV